MNQLCVYMCPSHPELPSYLPPQPIPLSCPSALDLSALIHASNLHWSAISHMVTYMFQFHSFKSSHPRLFQKSPKVCFEYLCLFCCLAYTVIINIFLNSIYMRYYTVLVFLFLTSLCIIGSSFIHLIRTDANVFFFMAE